MKAENEIINVTCCLNQLDRHENKSFTYLDLIYFWESVLSLERPFENQLWFMGYIFVF